jgi:hypothetical protein
MSVRLKNATDVRVVLHAEVRLDMSPANGRCRPRSDRDDPLPTSGADQAPSPSDVLGDDSPSASSTARRASVDNTRPHEDDVIAAGSYRA